MRCSPAGLSAAQLGAPRTARAVVLGAVRVCQDARPLRSGGASAPLAPRAGTGVDGPGLSGLTLLLRRTEGRARSPLQPPSASTATPTLPASSRSRAVPQKRVSTQEKRGARRGCPRLQRADAAPDSPSPRPQSPEVVKQMTLCVLAGLLPPPSQRVCAGVGWGSGPCGDSNLWLIIPELPQ